MQNFIYDIPTKIIFGPEQTKTVGEEIKKFNGSKVLFLYGKNSIKTIGLYDIVVNSLNSNNISFVELSGVKPNPSIESVREGQRLIKENGLDFILAVGGGSVIDCAKAIAAAADYDGDPWDLVIGKGTFKNPTPIGTILTLAATGSEMNAGAVISNEATEEKLVLFGDSLKPKFTFEDPTITYSLPKYQTAAGASDILAHLLEQYFSSHQDEGLMDRLTEAMMINVINNARIAIDTPDNYEARANLMFTSTLALNGMITYGKTGGDWATHMIEHEVSAIYDITHGAGLAILFPNILNYYLEKDLANSLSLVKFVNLAKNVFRINSNVDDVTIAKEAISRLREFFNSLDMPQTLADEKVNGDRISDMAKGSVRYGHVGSYHQLKYDDVVEILKRSL